MNFFTFDATQRGLIREVVTMLFAGLGTFGIIEGSLVETLTGLALTAFAVVWGVIDHEGNEAILTSVRKLLSMAGGVAVAIGWLEPDKAVAFVGVIFPLISLFWSVRTNIGNK